VTCTDELAAGAAGCSHQGEFISRFLLERRVFAGLALTIGTPVLASISNGYSDK